MHSKNGRGPQPEAGISQRGAGRSLTSSGWVVTGHLSEVGVVLYCKQWVLVDARRVWSLMKGIGHTLRTEELSRDVQCLATHNNDLLALEQLLSHRAGKATKEVALAIDRDLSNSSASSSSPISSRPLRCATPSLFLICQPPIQSPSLHGPSKPKLQLQLPTSTRRLKELTTGSKVDILPKI